MKATCETAPSLNTLRMHSKGLRVVASLSHQPVLTPNHMNANRDTQQEKHPVGFALLLLHDLGKPTKFFFDF